MFDFILTILIIVLFVKVFSLSGEVEYLAQKMSKLTNKDTKNLSNERIEATEPSPSSTNKQENKEEQKITQTNPVIACKSTQETQKSEETSQPELKDFVEEIKETLSSKAKPAEAETYTLQEYTKQEEKKESEQNLLTKEDKPAEKKDTINISKKMQFTAAKVFSWIAAFAFILAVIFGLIYAVQNNIISKQMITAAAGLIGLILLAAGLLMKDEKTKTAAATLCASGITTFFIATYCSFSLYNMINLPVAFALMATISFVSFYISVKKDMQFISFLGMVAAFITPLLLSTGNDNYIFFFTYIAFINGAAIAVSLKKGWNNLLITSLVFTLLCQFAWLLKEMTPNRINIFQIIFTIYSIAITAVYIKLKEKLPLFIKYVFSTFIIIGIAIIPISMLLIDQNSPILINLLLLLTVSQTLLLVLYYSEPKIFKVPAYFASSVFLFSLLIWANTTFATHPSGFLLLFIILCASFVNSLVINTKTGEPFTTITNLIALFAIFLMVINNNSKLENLLFVHNGAIIFNLALVAIAYKFKDKLTPFLKSSFGAYIVSSLLFSLLFAVQASMNKEFIFILINLLVVNASLLFLSIKEAKSYQLPLKICSLGILTILFYMCHIKNALFPATFSMFLIMGAVNLFTDLHYFSKEDKTFPIILAGLLFLGIWPNDNIYYIWTGLIFANLICLTLSRKYELPAFALIAALGSSLLFSKPTKNEVVILSGVFYLVFYGYPFLCKKDFKENSVCQWLASAFAAFFAWNVFLNHPKLDTNLLKGLTTLLFVPFFLFASVSLYKETLKNRYKVPFTIMSVMLAFFITTAISLIFSQQWLTLAFAVEGATLIVLNSKVPTKWGYKVGLCLLALAFFRLTCFMEYCANIDNQPVIFNWFLLVYSVTAGAIFIGAKYWPVKEEADNYLKTILNIAGTILIFILLNLEIASFFTKGGELLFNFSGNFAQTTTYTLAWLFFGAGLMFINKKGIFNSWAEKAGVLLLGISFIRLIFTDSFCPYIVREQIFNIYLPVYIIAATTILICANYLVKAEKTNIKTLLNILGAILLFHLINIEIANYFGQITEPLEFNFFGNFAATITYTIAWTLYGATACIIAFYKKYKMLLNAGIVIMTLSIIKLFMFDLWSLGIVYRIVGLFAIAGILFGISYIFQKFKDRLK